jgi:hypothetical protein
MNGNLNFKRLRFEIHAKVLNTLISLLLNSYYSEYNEGAVLVFLKRVFAFGSKDSLRHLIDYACRNSIFKHLVNSMSAFQTQAE